MNMQRLFPQDQIVLRELGLPDGLKLTRQYPTTAQKTEWLIREYRAGVRHFALGSLLPATRFPQFADLREPIGATSRLDGALSAALTLNERGVDDALKTQGDEMILVFPAIESHSMANTRRSRAEALEILARIDAQRRGTDRTRQS